MKNLYLSTKNRLPYGIAMILLTFGLIAFTGSNSFGQTTTVTRTTTGTQTWVVPSGVTKIQVEAWGAGGRGGNTTSNGSYTGGGGAGAYSKKTVILSNGDKVSLSVGAGSTTTDPGGNSTLSINEVQKLIARGGNSVGDNVSAGGTGGTWSMGDGDTGISGGNGENGNSNNQIRTGGAGGNSPEGGTGGTTTQNNNNGNPGNPPGGGGSGAAKQSGNTNYTGGAGANGQIVITYSTFSLTTTTAANVCQNTAATVEFTSNLNDGTYQFSYSISGENSGSGTAIVVVSSGAGTFTTTALTNTGSTTITITNISNDLYGNNISANHSATITVNPVKWLGTETDWHTPANWCGGVPTPTTDVLIPAGLANYPVIAAGASADCKNLTIESGASLTIESTETASGSLIVTGTSTGTVTYNRWLQAIYYQLISSPVNPSGWNNPNNIYSFITYNEATDKWTAQDPVPSVLENGRGYGMVADVAGTVNFTGSLNNGDVTIALDKTEVNQFIYGWNLVGNPYTSALLIKSESALATTFLSENAPDEGLGNIDASFQAVYVYDQTDYKVIGKAGFYPSQETALGQNLVQAGQAFFVKAAYQGANLVFKREMQAHGPAVALKSGHKSWPGVQLNVSSGESHHYTMVTYQGNMTPGLDPGYDAGLFSTGGEIELFTRLVNDNGVRFMIQAVPDYDFEQNAVPVGVNFAKGGEVTFSGFVVPLDGNYKIYLEDRLTGVLTDLSQDEYTVTLAANTKGTGRFFIVAAQATGIERPGEISDNLMVWASDRKIHIRGELSGKATARLLDLNGRLIMETSLPDTRNNLVQAPVRTGGIYLLQVLDGNRQTTRKVVIN